MIQPSLLVKIANHIQNKDKVMYIEKGLTLIQSGDITNIEIAINTWIGANVMYDYIAFLESYYMYTYGYIKANPPNWCPPNIKKLLEVSKIELTPSQLDLLAFSTFNIIDYRYINTDNKPFMLISNFDVEELSCELRTEQQFIIELPLAATKMYYGQTSIRGNDELMNRLISMFHIKTSKTNGYTIANKEDVILKICDFYECDVFDIPRTNILEIGRNVDLSNAISEHIIPYVSVIPAYGAKELDLSPLKADNVHIVEGYYLKSLKLPKNITKINLEIMLIGGQLPVYIDDVLDCPTLLECQLDMSADIFSININGENEWMLCFDQENTKQFFEFFYGAKYQVDMSFSADGDKCYTSLVKMA